MRLLDVSQSLTVNGSFISHPSDVAQGGRQASGPSNVAQCHSTLNTPSLSPLPHPLCPHPLSHSPPLSPQAPPRDHVRPRDSHGQATGGGGGEPGEPVSEVMGIYQVMEETGGGGRCETGGGVVDAFTITHTHPRPLIKDNTYPPNPLPHSPPAACGCASPSTPAAPSAPTWWGSSRQGTGRCSTCPRSR